MDLLNKKWGYRGMPSSKASVVKRAGHEDEKILANLIGVSKDNIIKGSWKTDLLNREGKRISLKSSHDRKGRSQICLYKQTSDYFISTNNGSTKRMQECLAVFPETREEYKSNERNIKKLLQDKMINLQRYINKSVENKKEYLDFIFRTDHDNAKVDFLIITDQDHNFFVFDFGEAIDALCQNTIVVNSVARHPYETPNLKVLFKAKSEDGEYVNIIENEIRTSTHYKRFLAVGNKLKYLYVLSSNIRPQKEIRKGLILCGKAIETFKL